MNNNHLAWLALCASMALCGPMVTSCGDDDEDSVTPNVPETPEVPETPTEGSLTASEQKVKLDAAGNAFVDKIDKDMFAYLIDLSEYIEDLDSDDSAIESWLEGIVKPVILSESTEKEEYSWSTYVYHIYETETIIKLSNFKGHFKLNGKTWTYSKADDLQFAFTDHQGKECTMTVKTSGKDKYFMNDEWEDWEKADDTDYYRDYYSYEEWHYNEKYYLPENLDIVVKQGSTVKASAKYSLDLSKISEQFNPETDALSGSMTVNVGDYSLSSTKAAYDATSGASIVCGLSKGSTSLLSASFSIEGNVQREDAQKVMVNIDLMGLVQVKGSISNGRDFYDYLDRAEHNEESESKFKSSLSLANDLLNLGVYYDGKPAREARIELEAFQDKDYWYGSYWYYSPVIYFGNASSYTMPDVFFETGFDKLQARFEKLVDDLLRDL